jgi:uncharacterized protein YaaR (DUF327 family)
LKINPGWRPFGKDVNRPDTANNQPLQQKSFSDMMQQQDQRSSQEQLRQMIEQIKNQGNILSKSMTVRELRAYKNLVKRFLEDTVRRGIILKETRGWDRRGRGKRYKLLEDIDKALLEMADEMLLSEQGKIQILNNVGEIRGMLINLVF